MPSQPSKRKPFEPWRKVMLAGALVLLVTYVLRAVVDNDLPGFVLIAGNLVGYVLLAWGFGMASRARGATPSDRYDAVDATKGEEE